MNHADPYLEPPHVSAAFYFDGVDSVEAFAGVYERVIAAGAVATGAFDIVHTDTFPHFAMISDLADRLESVQLDLPKENALKEWKCRLHAQEPTAHVVRAYFDAPHVGSVVLAFEPIPEGLGADVSHPICLTTSGQLLAMPSHVSLSQRDQQRASTVARFLMGVFRSVCDYLDPLYGSIAVESSLPTPVELASGGARIGTELFVSDRVIVADPELGGELARVFAGGFSQRWTKGLFFSGWKVFNPEGRTVEAPLATGTLAARRLGQALSVNREL